jgi:cyanophycinase
MIVCGKSGATPRAGMVDRVPGPGFISRVIIDQHFGQRDRLVRLLLTAVAATPCSVGIGLDDDAAAFIGPDDTLEVVGSGGVSIIDGSNPPVGYYVGWGACTTAVAPRAWPVRRLLRPHQ